MIQEYEPTDQELRLALELIEQWYPLYKKAPIETKANFIRDVFGYTFQTERLRKLKRFKSIVKQRKVFIKKLPTGDYIVKVRKVLTKH